MFPPYYEGRRWCFRRAGRDRRPPEPFADPDRYPIDSRGITYTFAFFSTKHSGIGQFYLMTIKDKDGQPSTAATAIACPPGERAGESVLVGDGLRPATHALIRDMARAGRSSQSPGLQTKADGSVDICFGPRLRPARRRTGSRPTPADFEVLFRFYGPEKPLFDKTWVLPDIEKVN